MRPTGLCNPHGLLASFLLNIFERTFEATSRFVNAVLVPVWVGRHADEVDVLVQCARSDVHMADWLVLHKLSICRIGYVLPNEFDAGLHFIGRCFARASPFAVLRAAKDIFASD